MLLVKAKAKNDAWQLFEAHEDLRYLNKFNLIEIPVFKNTNGYYEFDIGQVPEEQLPPAEVTHFTCLNDPNNERVEREKGLFRWATWRDGWGETHRVVTDGAIFICNSNGDTIDCLK